MLGRLLVKPRKSWGVSAATTGAGGGRRACICSHSDLLALFCIISNDHFREENFLETLCMKERPTSAGLPGRETRQNVCTNGHTWTEAATIQNSRVAGLTG